MIVNSPIINKNSLHFQDIIIVIFQQQLVVDEKNSLGFYQFEHIKDLMQQDCSPLPVKISEHERVYVIELLSVSDTYRLVTLRSHIHLLSYTQYQLASRAMQLITWSKQHRYCGQCGQITLADKNELALVCVTCDLHYYPRISPCMMCLIIRGDECLLAHHHRQPEKMYSTLAGFVEAGESLEQTVHREVMEEVSLKVNNLRYFSSQSWPFPHQLMVGYFVDYESGEIKLEDKEIEDAQWFRYDQLPTVPPLTTLSGKLIEAFVHSRKN